jgi:hypothetical protein
MTLQIATSNKMPQPVSLVMPPCFSAALNLEPDDEIVQQQTQRYQGNGYSNSSPN